MPFIIPIFIPHQGCPHDCIFCNQHQITGSGNEPVNAAMVRAVVTKWLGFPSSKRRQIQVAFYGGSFTCLEHSYQDMLLQAVAPYIDAGKVHSIRLSTRPDCMDRDIADFLKKRGVALVELGVQSLDEDVLTASGRGHDAASVKNAVSVLQEKGLQVGIQLMIGLPRERFASIRKTVREVIGLRPDCVRIYPVLVLRDSGLEKLYNTGRYTPLSLDKAVLLAAWMKKNFDEHDITVVRMGLQAGFDLEDALVAGPYHPAFGEMVKARLLFLKTRKLLAGQGPDAEVTLSISSRDQSVFRGPQSVNITRLQRLGLDKKFVLHFDPDQPRSTIALKSE